MDTIAQKQSFVGIDISKKRLDVFIYPEARYLKFTNDAQGHKMLIEALKGYNIKVIVFEASGGYEIGILLALQKNKHNVWRIEPRRVKAFKKSEGIYAKTDASDAKMLALFGAEKKQKYVQEPITEEALQLQSWVRRRDDLKKQLIAEKARLQQEFDIECKKFIKSSIEFIEKQMALVESKIKLLVDNNDQLQTKSRIAQSMKGVGPVLAAKILVSLSELGKASNKEIAALAGVAPYANESGSYKGRSFIRGGRAELRRDLYMAALSAAHHNPILKKFYEKLRKAGKKAKVAIIAVARKMLVILNAMFRKNEAWRIA
jgi:transposase